MTSESDSTSGSVSGRRPPTIELTATEVGQPKAPPGTATPATKPTTEGPAEAAAKTGAQAGAPEQKSSPEQAAPQKPSDPKPAAKAQGGLFPHAVSAVIGAVAAAVVLVGLWLAGFTLARDVVTSQTEGPQAVVPIAANSQITARLDKIEHALATPKPETPAVPPALANRLAAVEMQAKMLGDSAAALNHRVDDIAATAQAAQKQSTSAASAAADVAQERGTKRRAAGGSGRFDKPHRSAGKRGESAVGTGRTSGGKRGSGRAPGCRSASAAELRSNAVRRTKPN